MSIKRWPSCIMLAPMNCTSWACGFACTAACCHFSPEIDTSNTHATLLVAALDIQQACAAYEMELIPASYKSWWPEPRSDLQLVYLPLTDTDWVCWQLPWSCLFELWNCILKTALCSIKHCYQGTSLQGIFAVAKLAPGCRLRRLPL